VVAAVTAAGGTITMLIGAVLLRLTLTDTYRRYVRPELGVWLTLAGGVVIVLGFVTLLAALRRGRPTAVPDDHDHDHDVVGVGWLLLAPIAALLLVAPPTLGSYGVGRAATVDVRSGVPVFKSLARAAKPHPMTLLEFGQRSYDHNGTNFNGAVVELTGFVAAAEDRGFRLARYQIACCAADATPAVVRIVGTSGDSPPLDQWVVVTGTFHRSEGELPELTATSVVDIEPPNEPYE
jgi:uncharacterized repeat protein (TIGR03943 family)